MNISSTIEKNIQGADVRDTIHHTLRVEKIQPPSSNFWTILTEGDKRWLVDIGRPHHGALIGKCDGRGAPNALSGRCNQRNLSRESSAHFSPLSCPGGMASQPAK